MSPARALKMVKSQVHKSSIYQRSFWTELQAYLPDLVFQPEELKLVVVPRLVYVVLVVSTLTLATADKNIQIIVAAYFISTKIIWPRN